MKNKTKEPKVKIEPRGKYILVKPEKPKSKENEQGIILPANTEDEQKSQGDVLGVSPEVKGIKKGDRVVYGTFAGENLKMREGGKEVDYKLLHDDDVIAFVR